MSSLLEYGCSCFVNAPCSFCTSLTEEEAGVYYSEGIDGLKTFQRVKESLMIDLDTILVSQDMLRETKQIRRMVDFVRAGQFWTLEAIAAFEGKKSERNPLIMITRFEDGLMMIHDGHHRCVATVIGGRHHLRDDEYTVTDWTYASYLEICFEQKWVTPFDPRTHVRLPDFYKFKEAAILIAEINKDKAIEFIKENMSLYARPRLLENVEDLASRFSLLLPHPEIKG